MLLINFYICIILSEASWPDNSRKMRGGDIECFRSYRLSYLGCPDFVGTIGLGYWLPRFLVILALGLERTLVC